MSDHVGYRPRDGVGRITLDRPDKKNAIDGAMYTALAQALAAARRDDDVRAILIDAEGSAFTAGNDIADFLETPPVWGEAPVWHFLGALAAAEKPVVAAVGGIAVGIGTTLLLHCDLVVASTAARFHLPFVDLGLVPEAASSLLLPQLVGHQRAAAMLLLGEAIDAATALAYGLVNRVVEPDALGETSLAWALRLAAKPPGAIRLAKQLLRRAPESVSARMAAEAEVFARQLSSHEAREAFETFLSRKTARPT